MNEKIKKLVTHHSSLITHKQGFTLIELAIVLVIVGLLLGLGAGLIGPLTKRTKIVETKETINAAIESVISYGAANNKLPDTSAFSTTVRNPNDSWQKSLYYILDNNLTDTTIGGICGRKTTNITVRICPDAACTSPTNTINNVAFIVLSGDGNYNNQTAGTQAVTTATTISTYEVGVDNVDNYSGDMNRPEEYDDIVKWITIDELRIKAGCTGAQLKIVNNELPYGFENSSYSATVLADGGVPFSSGGEYRWCRQGNLPNGLTANPSTSSSDCSGISEGLWGQNDTLTISGTPTCSPSTDGNYPITFFVRDNNDSTRANDNIAQKTFVLTVNPIICP